MIRFQISWILLLSLLFASDLYSQDIHVRQTYDRRMGVTRLKSDRMVLINSPDQLLEAQFIATWEGESRVGTPRRILVELTSHTLQPIYRGQNPRLIVVADEKSNDLGPLGFSGVFRQVSGDPPSIYDSRDATVVRVPISPEALVLVTNPKALLTAEVLHTQDIEFGQIANMAGSKTVTLKLELTIVNLTDDQMAIVRAFERNLMPPGKAERVANGTVPREPGLADNVTQPLDLTSASLELTLSWLKKQLATNGVDGVFNNLARTEIADTSGCRVTFRAASLDGESLEDFAILGPTTDYVVDFADLSPESSLITRSSPRSTAVRFATHDNKRVVQVIVRKAVTGKEYDRSLDYSLSINFRNAAPVFQIRNVMARAIRLCHAPR